MPLIFTIYNPSTDQTSQRHHVNVCPLLLAVNAQDWIPTASKVRLLEWKIRFDLFQYAAQGCPPLDLEKIVSYVPKEETRKSTLGKATRIKAKPPSSRPKRKKKAGENIDVLSADQKLPTHHRPSPAHICPARRRARLQADPCNRNLPRSKQGVRGQGQAPAPHQGRSGLDQGEPARRGLG